MLRLLVLALLLANGLFFAWARGWLGDTPRHAEREPERLLAQVRPELLTVLPPKAATAAVQAARAASAQCLEAGPFADADLAAAEAALAAAQLPESSWARVDSASAPVWLVYAGRYPDAPLRKVREEDLRKLKLTFEVLNSPAELAPGFVLSRQPSRTDAEAWIKQRAPEALRGVRVVLLPQPPSSYRLRVARADSEQAERLRALPSEGMGSGFRPCAAKS